MENDGTVSMNIFAGTLAAGTIMIFLAQYLPDKPMEWISVAGAIVVSAGLLWISTRRIHVRAHTAADIEKKK